MLKKTFVKRIQNGMQSRIPNSRNNCKIVTLAIEHRASLPVFLFESPRERDARSYSERVEIPTYGNETTKTEGADANNAQPIWL